jgi:hypothetical protein
MKRPKTLAAFSPSEKVTAHQLLAARVAYMMGRKFEEDDWAEVYCRAKGIQKRAWSNLEIDVMSGSLGVEQKMMKVESKGDIADNCGMSMMHPAATRSIRVPSVDTDADVAMAEVLKQYGELIARRAKRVQVASGSETPPDMRTGWLLWQESLRQFLYFEEEMLAPDPKDYTAEWIARVSRGARKSSTNLWIFEKESGRKRYSVTTEAGAKIQPYFDIPPLNDPNLCIFTVIGEVISASSVRVWITESTRRELAGLVGNLKPKTVSKVVLETAKAVAGMSKVQEAQQEQAFPLQISIAAYQALQASLPGVSDEHSFQLLVQHLRELKA